MRRLIPVRAPAASVRAAATGGSTATTTNNTKNNNNMDLCTPTDKVSNNNAADFERIIRRPHLFQQSKIKPSPTFSFGGILVKDYVYSLDEDVAQIDHLLKQVSKFALLTWISLIGISYWAAPPGSIQRYTGAERNALLVELSILTMMVLVKRIPLVWEMNVMEMSTPSIRTWEKSMHQDQEYAQKEKIIWCINQGNDSTIHCHIVCVHYGVVPRPSHD